jgi:hypothetical protein
MVHLPTASPNYGSLQLVSGVSKGYYAFSTSEAMVRLVDWFCGDINGSVEYMKSDAVFSYLLIASLVVHYRLF